MSNTESFIDEVSEEVRRDKLFRLMRRYGWIGIAVVVLVVGGAAYNEWQKAQNISAAESFGDSVLAALDSDEPAMRIETLNAIETQDDARAVLELMSAAEQISRDDPKAGAERLDQIANDSSLSLVYRELAALKRVIALGAELEASERQSILAGMAVPGAPFRLLAEEQLALLEVEQGQVDAAVGRLKSIIADAEVSPGLRNRASQLIVALGGEIDTI